MKAKWKSPTNCKNKIKGTLISVGFVNPSKVVDTLQGSIWKTKHQFATDNIVVKVADKRLHSESVAVIRGIKHTSMENIVSETEIQKYLTYGVTGKDCPDSIVKYIHSFQSNHNYYLVMEYGGESLFDFAVRIHAFISKGLISICEWHKAVKVIFKQMIECIEYIHTHNVYHFDISLENFLINDVGENIQFASNGVRLQFPCSNIQIKLCDFGLAHLFKENASLLSSKFCGKPGYKSPEITNKQKFDAQKNDIWCLGICLWLLIVGKKPWTKASTKCESFNHIMIDGYAGIVASLSSAKRSHYVNKELVALFQLFFQYEEKRSDLLAIKKCEWYKIN